ncbi:MAG TPA: glycosyltransferase [Gaiellaceae bacterium]|nr:glycosyltransferase [Gaiellaceae bacterium]
MASPASGSPLPLLWSGLAYGFSGLAEELRSFLQALEGAGTPAAARELRRDAAKPGGTGVPAADRALARPVPEGEHVHVLHCPPLERIVPNDRGPVVHRTMYETDRVPAHWSPNIHAADELWVPSEFNVETFQRGGLSAHNLRVLPETLDFDLFAPGVEPWPLAGRRGFAFLTTFDFTDRKGWDVLLDAWADAFDPDDDVCLVLKCSTAHMEADLVRARLATHVGSRPTAPVLLNFDELAIDEMPRLYAAADAYVMPSRGEGWGRPYMEAMAMGLPTIGSRWSGNLAFMHDGNSFLVDGKVRPIERWEPLAPGFWQGHSWFEPDRDSLVAALRDVRAGRDPQRAAGARAELVERFGPGPTAARIAELTGEALERWRSRANAQVAFTWRGEWGSIHSLAVVNDAIASAAELEPDVAVRRQPIDGTGVLSDEVGVAQQWPPSFEPPTAGPFVLYQPWEFGEIPAAWVDPIRLRVDEVWTPSEYARRSYVRAGIAPELVHVVPNGVDLDRFSPEGPRRTFATARGTVFLFVGGTTYRKGIDRLLEAWRRAFTAADDVCLVIKGFGGTTLYRGQTANAAIEEFRALPDAPEIVLLDDDLAFDEIPALYRGADCLVQPYRGEGFCLPALEGLACGLPVIVTRGGPTDDFTSDDCAWYVGSQPQALPAGALPAHLQPAGGGFMLEPDLDDLVAALRAATDADERGRRAQAARAHAERFSWPAAARIALERVHALAGRAPIREVPPAALSARRRVLLAIDAEWDDTSSWAPGIRAFADAFGPDDDVTLLLPIDDPSRADAVTRELVQAGADFEALGDLVLADAGELAPDSLALTVDAFIAAAGRGPSRAAHCVEPDADALKSFVLQTT